MTELNYQLKSHWGKQGRFLPKYIKTLADDILGTPGEALKYA